MTAAILDHLWQSTLVAILAYALTLLLRNNSASVRHWLWFAASMKFLLPFSLLAALGRMAFVHPVAASSMAILTKIQPAATPFSAVPLVVAPVAGHSASPGFLVAIWLLGFVSLAAFWFVRWRRLLAIVHSAIPLAMELPVRVRTTPLLLEPGLVGIWRPVILLPEGIAGRLSRTEIDAILTHELCHLRRRDNLLAVAHMLVEGIFWFHPLVWFIGAHLVEEREHACDEGVLAAGKNPREYAQAILNVCRLYFRSPLACASGVSGADLDRRITAIMANRDVHDMDPGRKFLLVSLGVFMVMAPLVTGSLKSVPAARVAQGIARVFSPLERTDGQTTEPVVIDAVSHLATAQGIHGHHQRSAAPHATSHIRTAMLVAPKIEAITPIIIVPLPQIAVDSSPPVERPQADASETDVTICRPPQQLADSRLMGPQVCLPKREWDRMKRQGVQLLPDGRTQTASYDVQRILNQNACHSVLGGGALTGLSTCIQ